MAEYPACDVTTRCGVVDSDPVSGRFANRQMEYGRVVPEREDGIADASRFLAQLFSFFIRLVSTA